MNDSAKEWIEALRSGEYKQGRIFLKGDHKFCCLGVACELTKDRLGLDVSGSQWSSYDGCTYFWPPKVADEMGIDDDFASYLATMNDRGDSFLEIADAIEGYFAQKDAE